MGDVVSLIVFQVLFDPDRTRIDIGEGAVMGWGVQFPSGDCIVDWNREAYPEEDRLDHAHLSFYGSIDDVEQGTGGIVEMEKALEMPRNAGVDD